MTAVTQNRDCRHTAALTRRQSFQRGFVAYQECGALGLHDLPLFQIGEQPRHRLPRRSDHLRNFLVRQCQLQSRFLFRSFTIPRRPLQQQLGQLLSR